MVTAQFICDVCKTPYELSSLAAECEKKPIQHNSLKPGFVFKLDRQNGGGWIGNHGYFAKEESAEHYGVIESLAKPDQNHLQMYNMFVFFEPWLNENHNPYWVHYGEMPGNSKLIGIITDKEFASIRERIEYWTHKSQAFDGFSYKQLKPEEKLTLTNRL